MYTIAAIPNTPVRAAASSSDSWDAFMTPVTGDMHYNIGCIYNDVISDADRRAEEARKKGENSVATAAASVTVLLP